MIEMFTWHTADSTCKYFMQSLTPWHELQVGKTSQLIAAKSNKLAFCNAQFPKVHMHELQKANARVFQRWILQSWKKEWILQSCTFKTTMMSWGTDSKWTRAMGPLANNGHGKSETWTGARKMFWNLNRSMKYV